MVQIVDIINSPRKNKRFRAFLDDNTKIDFGLLGANTYLDTATKLERDNYRIRHYNSSNEKSLIDNLIISPSLLSYYLIWGEYRSILKNVKILNKLLKNV
jgi:hypothetical protein